MIKDIINEWDPIDLFPYAPADEYENEVHLLEDFVKSKEMSEEILGNEIYKIFEKRFGSDVFKRNKFECSKVANRILEEQSGE